MSRKVFVSFSHRLDEKAAEEFRKLFADERDVFVLIGSEIGGRKWVDREIYNSSRKRSGNNRNGLLGVRIKHKKHWVPERLKDNVPEMGLILDWPRDRRTLANNIETRIALQRAG